ncbi:bifunctional lysylphosphatidylglycerol synthetase/lysine--tRNA ligase LysX [Corynebacterium cystitidis]|uniref:bifunctional lysylphosphatidylglycerol synthetase/lysine--tRNA ligase LysX n=1 Tax=Corynebacterium cystitidis TaxID=35757 RepID=UPI00211E47C9|nr:bifunctional lysylphosphatidylglycerol synthetase/lysine--tRNA ligase LysX [Corynebacterium cystitidis]
MRSHWQSHLILGAAQLSVLWLAVGIILGEINPKLVDAIYTVFFLAGLPAFPTLVLLVITSLLVSGMLRGLRAAFITYIALFPGMSALVSLGYGGAILVGLYSYTPRDVVYTVISLVAAFGWLCCSATAIKDFPARLRRCKYAALGALVAGLGLSVVITWMLLLFFTGFGPGYGVLLAFDTALSINATTDALTVQTVAPGWITFISHVVSALAVLNALRVLLRVPAAKPATEYEYHALRRIIAGSDAPGSLDYFAANDDRSTIFSRDGQAAVSFRLISGVAVAAGDPIGRQASWTDAVNQWIKIGTHNGWILSVASTSDVGARVYQQAGMSIARLGDEAVISTEKFRLKNLPEVRRDSAAAKNAGYTVSITRQGDMSAEALAELRHVVTSWRTEKERGFTMASGRVGDPRDPRTVVVMARDPQGEPMGVLTFVPWGSRGVSLDVMLRSPQAVSGVTELMVSTLATEGPEQGIERFSLNFVTFREALTRGGMLGASPLQKLLLKFLVLSSRWWQIYSLYQSNVKYQPEWVPRYFGVMDYFHAARCLISFAAGEGFLPFGGVRTTTALGQPELIEQIEQEALRPALAPRQLSPLQKHRHGLVQQMRATGHEPYPARVPRNAELDHPRKGTVSVTGRVRYIRNHGGVIFADIVEGENVLQLIVERATQPAHTDFRRWVGRGDIVSVTGTHGTSRTGHPSLLVQSWEMAAKCLVPVPMVASADLHTRAMLRHMDFALNPDARRIFIARCQAVAAVRSVLQERGYLEAETPILQTIHGGANARPFRTHINAYDQNLTLRIAPELYLKRLVVGGFEKVYEIGRNFRNEGVDATHNPEFTSLEVYQAFGDWDTMRELTEEIVRAAALAVHGSLILDAPDGSSVDLGKPWPVVYVVEAVSEAVGETIDLAAPLERYQHLIERYGLQPSSVGDLVTELYDELVEPTTVAPTFYAGFPTETSPLTMVDPEQPLIAQRWDLVAFGMELGTAYTELADPVEQRARLEQQSLLAAGGDVEAMEIDEDFLTALEFGFPPTGGMGMGIDRLVLLLMSTTIREVLAFPFVKPRN